MKIKHYYPNHFISDTKILQDAGISCQCNRIWSKIYKEELDLKLTNIALFVLCSYQLNLINQILYNYFNHIHQIWKSTTPFFIDCRCSYLNSPIEMIRYAKLSSQDAKRKIKISRSDILEADKLFLNEITNSNHFNINSEELKAAISNDPDCNIQALLRIII